ncbi:hypothetical protein FKV42_12085 [Methanolobus vulcani]|uniref:ABC transmembrane type-1 domain-containing protein n=1 Tax=Methanolobus vulcani TaxID=38026 RepID=A0A7Z8KM06_9EURY|nr:hypothetical protein [Methanolobus vulcani]TQD23934.1 hypothetical protein FKV42_12085 [Methanolobus vulcani]
MVKTHIQILKEKSVEIISIFSTIVLWQIISVYVVGNKFYLPSFTDVAGALVEILSRDSSLAIMGAKLQLPMLVVDFLYSMMHFSIGLIAALIIGIPIGMIMGWFRTIDRIVDPIIEIIRPIPPACMDSFCDHMDRSESICSRFSDIHRCSFPYNDQYFYRF